MIRHLMGYCDYLAEIRPVLIRIKKVITLALSYICAFHHLSYNT
jgi:hypothetical protein